MSQTNGMGVLIGESPAIRKARYLIARLGPTRLNVLIEGPTGTGKELVAEALHMTSGRKGPFVACNVCAIPDSMFEDTMFGHARGAFSGATGDHRGYMAEADGGTLFLDELSGLAPRNQLKLLRALETRRFRAVGARVDGESDFRVFGATNVPLASLTASGVLREDLAHRIAAAVVTLPPLRQRVTDIPELTEHFLAHLDVDRRVSITPPGLRELMSHDWPGNVRELRNVLERAIALADSPMLDESCIRGALGDDQVDSGGLVTKRGFAQRRLLEVLHENDWDIAATSRQLGVHRSTLWRRLRRLRGSGDLHMGGGAPPLDSTSLG